MKIELVSWHLGFLDELVEQANNFKIARFVRDAFPHPYTHKSGKFFIENVAQPNPKQIFAIVVDGKLAGGTGIFPQSDVYRKNAEVGYWLGESFWGRGIATESVKRIVSYGFETFDIVRIYAGVFESNIASMRVLEKVGFQLEKISHKTVFKNEQFLDEYMYSIRKEKL